MSFKKNKYIVIKEAVPKQIVNWKIEIEVKI